MFDEICEQDVRDRVKLGESNEAIARHYGLTRGVIARYLHAHGIVRHVITPELDLDTIYAGRRYDD